MLGMTVRVVGGEKEDEQSEESDFFKQRTYPKSPLILSNFPIFWEV